jgi:diamine N-acetyltransferase
VSGLAFRAARREDAPAIARLIGEAFSTYDEWAAPGWERPDLDVQTELQLQARLGTPECWALLGESDRAPVGYVALVPARVLGQEPRHRIPGLAHLWHLFVLRDWWGTGLAAHLLDEAVAEARRRGYREARLFTPRDNKRARAFYEREGWSDSGLELFGDDLELQLVEYRRMLAP